MVNIEIPKRDLISILVAASKESCRYEKLQEENELWEFHCCDYNDPIKKLAEQVKGVDFEDEDYNKFVRSILKEDSKRG